MVRRDGDRDFRWLFYYVTPEDTARAFRLALERDGGPEFDIAFVTAADSCTTEPTLERLERILGRLPEIRDPARYESNPRASAFDGSHALEAASSTPHVPNTSNPGMNADPTIPKATLTPCTRSVSTNAS